MEPAGTTATVDFVYRSHDTHVLYGEGFYEGPPLARTLKGRGVFILKTGYVRETNDRYYITSRMDCFVSVEPAGAELLTKTVAPFVAKTVDNNFLLTLAFVGSLSRTAEVNARGVRRLASQLSHVDPDVCDQFADLSTKLSEKSSAAKEAAAKAAKAEISRRAESSSAGM